MCPLLSAAQHRAESTDEQRALPLLASRQSLGQCPTLPRHGPCPAGPAATGLWGCSCAGVAMGSTVDAPPPSDTIVSNLLGAQNHP